MVHYVTQWLSMEISISSEFLGDPAVATVMMPNQPNI